MSARKVAHKVGHQKTKPEAADVSSILVIKRIQMPHPMSREVETQNWVAVWATCPMSDVWGSQECIELPAHVRDGA